MMGELPEFEPGAYTFIADYVPWANGDGMEHRNSTVITSSAPIGTSRGRLVGTVAHEFFHAWNVERIRPRSLEPFDLDDANTSGELWLAEGFTSYVEGLTMVRTGLVSFESALARWSGLVNALQQSPAVRLRSAIENSQMAPFVDAACSVDRTNWENLHLSYYTHGAAVALALDLALRERSDGRVSLDDYLRALWSRFGRPGTAAEPGRVATPYTLDDLRGALAETAGDEAFAADFFGRYVEGREVFDYGARLERAGVAMTRAHPGAATIGAVAFDFSRGTARVSAPTPFGSPAYLAGLAQDDELQSLDGQALSSADGLRRVLEAKRPGQAVRMEFTRRSGERVTATVPLTADTVVRLRRTEAAGGALTDTQRRWRLAWIGSRVR